MVTSFHTLTATAVLSFSLQISVHYLNPPEPQMDLVLMGRADYFIGNCVSSFTAFVKRERDVKQKPSEFFGFDTVRPRVLDKTELWCTASTKSCSFVYSGSQGLYVYQVATFLLLWYATLSNDYGKCRGSCSSCPRTHIPHLSHKHMDIHMYMYMHTIVSNCTMSCRHRVIQREHSEGRGCKLLAGEGEHINSSSTIQQ